MFPWISHSIVPSWFLNLLIYFFNSPTYYSLADFTGWFLLQGKSSKAFDIVALKLCFFKFRIWGFGGLWLGSLPPPPFFGCASDFIHLSCQSPRVFVSLTCCCPLPAWATAVVTTLTRKHHSFDSVYSTCTKACYYIQLYIYRFSQYV